jgi:thiamine kinase
VAASDAPEVQARALLAAHPEGRALAALLFRPLAGGALNRSWRVGTADRACYVRLAEPEARHLGADWESEAVLLDIASAAGLAPRPLIAVPAAGLLVCEFLDGRVLSALEARTPSRIEAIGRLLRAVHELPPSAGIRKLDFAVQARALEARLDAADRARFRGESGAVFERLTAGRGPAVPCHNDVHAENLLDTESRLVLVDWEYGGVGDAVFDLAGLASHLSLDAAQRAHLLDAYGSREAGMRLTDACWAYDYVQWLWYRAAAQGVGRGDVSPLVEAGLGIERRLEKAIDHD